MRALYSLKKTIDESESMIASIRPVLIIVAQAIILAIIGKILWNKTLVPLVSIVKPMKNWYDVIGIYILLTLISSPVVVVPA